MGAPEDGFTPNPPMIDCTGITDEGVTWTLLATLYLRAMDSRLSRPILGDRYAAEAVARIDYDFTRLRRRLNPNASQFLVALRARQFDEWSAAFLARHADAVVVQLGCGFDSRALRLDPERRTDWFDLDIPQVIELRRQLYPADGAHRLIASSVLDPGWQDDVPADRPVLLIAEGLLPYLAPDEVRTLLRRLTGHFATGELIFDTMAPWITRLVPSFRWSPRDGREIERAVPRLARAEQLSFATHHRRIPWRGYRTLYRLMYALPGVRDMAREHRFVF